MVVRSVVRCKRDDRVPMDSLTGINCATQTESGGTPLPFDANGRSLSKFTRRDCAIPNVIRLGTRVRITHPCSGASACHPGRGNAPENHCRHRFAKLLGAMIRRVHPRAKRLTELFLGSYAVAFIGILHARESLRQEGGSAVRSTTPTLSPAASNIHPASELPPYSCTVRPEGIFAREFFRLGSN